MSDITTNKEVFILGSGFSRELFNDMPLLNHLTEHIFKRIEEENSLFKNTYEKYIKDKNIGNFEDILTYLYQNFPWKSEKEFYLLFSLYIHISEILVEILQNIQSRVNYSGLFHKDCIAKFLRYLHISRANVITLNYDTLLENASIQLSKPLSYTEAKPGANLEEIDYIVDKDGKYTADDEKVKIVPVLDKKVKIYLHDHNITENEFNLGLAKIDNEKVKNDLKSAYQTIKTNLFTPSISFLDIYPIPIQRLPSRTTTLYGHHFRETYKLFKIHGSINWYYSGHKDKIAEQIYLLGSTKITEVEEKNIKDLVPVIIPPVLDKTGFFKQGTIRAQWSEVKNILRYAEKIYIIGYSIPATDLTVKFMLQSHINKDAEIVIVNIDENRKDYFRTIFSNSSNYNEQYIGKDVNVFEKFVNDRIKM